MDGTKRDGIEVLTRTLEFRMDDWKRNWLPRLDHAGYWQRLPRIRRAVNSLKKDLEDACANTGYGELIEEALDSIDWRSGLDGMLSEIDSIIENGASGRKPKKPVDMSQYELDVYVVSTLRQYGVRVAKSESGPANDVLRVCFQACGMHVTPSAIKRHLVRAIDGIRPKAQ